MKIIYGTNEAYYSRLHRFFEKAPITHIALCFTLNGKDIVVEATRPCGRQICLSRWQKRYQLKAIQEIEFNEELEFLIYLKIKKEIIGIKYDFPAYFFGWFWALLTIWKKDKQLYKNPFNSLDKKICTEILDPIKDDLHQYNVCLNNIDLSGVTPFMLYKKLSKEMGIHNVYKNF